MLDSICFYVIVVLVRVPQLCELEGVEVGLCAGIRKRESVNQGNDEGRFKDKGEKHTEGVHLDLIEVVVQCRAVECKRETEMRDERGNAIKRKGVAYGRSRLR